MHCRTRPALSGSTRSKNPLTMIETGPDLSQLSPKEKRSQLDRLRTKTAHLTKQLTYHWRAVEYDESNAPLYLVARAAADHASLVRVLAEIRAREPHHRPQSLFDFGSGVGMVNW